MWVCEVYSPQSSLVSTLLSQQAEDQQKDREERWEVRKVGGKKKRKWCIRDKERFLACSLTNSNEYTKLAHTNTKESQSLAGGERSNRILTGVWISPAASLMLAPPDGELFGSKFFTAVKWDFAWLNDGESEKEHRQEGLTKGGETWWWVNQRNSVLENRKCCLNI